MHHSMKFIKCETAQQHILLFLFVLDLAVECNFDDDIIFLYHLNNIHLFLLQSILFLALILYVFLYNHLIIIFILLI
jgi:hypothetical protein